MTSFKVATASIQIERHNFRCEIDFIKMLLSSICVEISVTITIWMLHHQELRTALSFPAPRVHTASKWVTGMEKTA